MRGRGGLAPLSALCLVFLAAGLAACGDDDSSSSSSSDGGGEAIKLGVLSQEGIPVGSQPEAREASEAAVRYVNEKFNGVDGRKLELVSCITNGTPSRSATCASDLVSKGVIAVSMSNDNGATGSIPVLAKAKVPLVGGGPTGGPESTSPNAFLFVGGSAGNTAGRVAFAKDTLHAQTAVVTGVDVPAGVFAMKQQQAALTKAQISSGKVLPFPATTSDFTQLAAQIAARKPDVIFASPPPQACPALYRALHQAGVVPAAKVIGGASCATEDVAKAAGPENMTGVYWGSDYEPFTSESPDMVAFLDAMKTYSPKTPFTAYTPYGFQSVMNTYQLLKEMAEKKQEINSANLIATLEKTKDHPNFLGKTYTCDKQQVPAFPAVCSAYMTMWTYTNGQFTFASKERWTQGRQYLPAT